MDGEMSKIEMRDKRCKMAVCQRPFHRFLFHTGSQRVTVEQHTQVTQAHMCVKFSQVNGCTL